LVGMEECVGGRAREDVEGVEGLRLGSGPRAGGAMSPAVRLGGAIDPAVVEGWVGTAFNRGGPRVPPEARWTEFKAGKEGADGSSSSCPSEVLSPNVKVGVVEARGVVGDEGDLGVRFLKGAGGGGIAFLSSLEEQKVNTCSCASGYD
jgi:hypothetical protein